MEKAGRATSILSSSGCAWARQETARTVADAMRFMVPLWEWVGRGVGKKERAPGARAPAPGRRSGRRRDDLAEGRAARGMVDAHDAGAALEDVEGQHDGLAVAVVRLEHGAARQV